MANSSTGKTSSRKRRPASAWRELAQPGDSKRVQWVRGKNHTEFVARGEPWDAVSIKPMGLGLDALAGLRLGTRRGYLVLADHLRVPPGTLEAFAGIPGVRVLSQGHQVLMPRSRYDSSPVADWVGAPRDEPLLVHAERLAARLQDLTASAYEGAAPS